MKQEKKELKVRMAQCSDAGGGGKYGCKGQVPSDPNLAFFEARPDQELDRFYCGCFGWD